MRIRLEDESRVVLPGILRPGGGLRIGDLDRVDEILDVAVLRDTDEERVGEISDEGDLLTVRRPVFLRIASDSGVPDELLAIEIDSARDAPVLGDVPLEDHDLTVRREPDLLPVFDMDGGIRLSVLIAIGLEHRGFFTVDGRMDPVLEDGDSHAVLLDLLDQCTDALLRGIGDFLSYVHALSLGGEMLSLWIIARFRIPTCVSA